MSEAYEVVIFSSIPRLLCLGLRSSSAVVNRLSTIVQVLKDPGKRATYDAIKDGFPSQRSPPYSGGTATYANTDTSYTYYKPGGGTADQDPFDEFFAKWWAKRERE